MRKRLEKTRDWLVCWQGPVAAVSVVAFFVILCVTVEIDPGVRQMRFRVTHFVRGNSPWHHLHPTEDDDMLRDMQFWNLGGTYTLRFTSHNPGTLIGDSYTWVEFQPEQLDPVVAVPPGRQARLSELSQDPELLKVLAQGKYKCARGHSMIDGRGERQWCNELAP